MTTDTSDRQLGWVVLAIVAALFVLPAFAMGSGMMGAGPVMDGHGGHGTWGATDGAHGWMLRLGVGFQLAFLAILLGAGSLGYRRLTAVSESADPALEELRIAYAYGDLDDEEFERRRERLEADRQAWARNRERLPGYRRSSSVWWARTNARRSAVNRT